MKPSRKANVLTVWLFSFLFVLGLQNAGCIQASQAETSSVNDVHHSVGNALDEETLLRLRYRVLGDYLTLPYCSEQVRQAEVEQAKARFSVIQKDAAVFGVIVEHLGLAAVRRFGPDEQFLVYREHQRLQAVQLEPAGDKIKFTVAKPDRPNCADLDAYPSTGLIDPRNNVIAPAGRLIAGLSGTNPAQPAPSPLQSTLNNPQLRSILLQHFGDSVGCRPKRDGQAERSAELGRFSVIRQDTIAFQVLLQRLGLTGSQEFLEEQKLLVTREYSKLLRIQLEPLAQKFQFKMLVRDPKRVFKHNDLFNIDGLIDSRGEITQLKQTPVWYSPCLR
ncbi:MAG TPA: hypothetical protein VGQ12_17885 [Candidatus Angelobacter sp.]|jgi:hypothetical protein|nr:hypothetical protein [Candidatus Angelobacter sp.]